ncbi:monovalent cation/H+ antiporter complex subunit F [Candidatus Anaplasma sp. TIGMIC]|uniref:monovalent cation/H+ antiporter complex subunit F n=1 Tax=Candidatus Anaplasma sp. TIGMIC TaxID=3020713 RepID=UPI00232C764E|nr:monovalent cation/H+ antiporter complex subunit F [Candidatus Anaplasma sp. TIGMIC]MDB1135024.1 monovalent cation/H+ antiporter complex subunit F [Candidatus Anaplasma sp. TIGMIC]
MGIELLTLAVFVLLVCKAAMLLRIVSASNVYDKMLAVSVFNTCIVITIMILGTIDGSAEFFIDVSLMYACVGLVASVGFAKFFLYGGWGK